MEKRDFLLVDVRRVRKIPYPLSKLVLSQLADVVMCFPHGKGDRNCYVLYLLYIIIIHRYIYIYIYIYMYICVTVQVTAYIYIYIYIYIFLYLCLCYSLFIYIYIYIYIYLLLSTCTRVSFLIKYQPETLQLSESRDSGTDVVLQSLQKQLFCGNIWQRLLLKIKAIKTNNTIRSLPKI